ncbi:leucine zipper transcription factor-like protein 1 [Octopus bimaculoides]|uniref:Leucine zipper transcription factor-like protein 1 n=1 Tax=Octopus bimaculoides TaxID=37653 RepID=A0A0L8HNX2_OCTBM|nr:leucine zipper transcription factor-like protein 1 [Octopus bimaculoides]|eukprot:XP_014770725.1 PREDICTED: leucine zipper transcription factor-like protein 1 [Octopus bimaculoides]
MTSVLGLNEHHQAQVLAYMRFVRFHRSQQLRAISSCFNDVKCSRLTEDTYTNYEVEELLDGLLQVIRGDMESELINMAHTNILLLRQMFQQSENWHLKLKADISELENVELLEKIKLFEEQEFSSKKKDSPVRVKLMPMNESGGSDLLQMRITELEEENARLKQKLSRLEGQAIDVLNQKEKLSERLILSEKQLKNIPNWQHQKPDNDEVIQDLEKQMTDLKTELQMNQNTQPKLLAVESDLSVTKQELLKVNEMLELAEKEMEKKVSQTAPFKNLKSMLQKKNEQIKELRQRLSKYEETEDA